MRKYRVTSFLTLSGIRRIVELSDMTYGEWIIYEGRIPKYHIASFDGSKSSKKIDALLDSKKETLDTILTKINKATGQSLCERNSPFIRIKLSSELVELDLKPIPLEWLNMIEATTK